MSQLEGDRRALNRASTVSHSHTLGKGENGWLHEKFLGKLGTPLVLILTVLGAFFVLVPLIFKLVSGIFMLLWQLFHGMSQWSLGATVLILFALRLGWNHREWQQKQKWLEAVRVPQAEGDQPVYKTLPPRAKADREIALSAVISNPKAFEHLNPSLQQDPDIILLEELHRHKKEALGQLSSQAGGFSFRGRGFSDTGARGSYSRQGMVSQNGGPSCSSSCFGGLCSWLCAPRASASSSFGRSRSSTIASRSSSLG